MQVLEHPQPDAPHGPLGHATEQRVAHLAEQHVQEARDPVGKHQPQHRRHGECLWRGGIKGIDHTFQQEGRADRAHFGEQQAEHGERDPFPVLGEPRQHQFGCTPVESGGAVADGMTHGECGQGVSRRGCGRIGSARLSWRRAAGSLARCQGAGS